MNLHWYTLASPAVPASLVEVWVSESHTLTDSEVSVTWTLHCSEALPETLVVQVEHTSFVDGKLETWPWELPAGQTSVSGYYTYARSILGPELKFGLKAGVGYSLPDSPERPKEVVIPIDTAPTTGKPVPDKYSVSYTDRSLVLTDADFVNGKYVLQNENLRNINNELNFGSILDYSKVSAGYEIIADNCLTMSTGIPFFGGYSKAKLTITNTFSFPYEKEMPDARGWGRYMATAVNPEYVRIEHCYVEDMGLVMLEYNRALQSVCKGYNIRYNKAKNVYGLGKFQNFIKVISDGAQVPNQLIEYNQALNIDGQCRVEDNINLYHISGTSASPVVVRHNFIDGASKSYQAASYTGGGIIVDCAHEATFVQVPKYLDLYDNQLVRCHNYTGVAAAGGMHIRIFNNRAVCAAVTESGEKYADWTSGFWTDNYTVPDATESNPYPTGHPASIEVFDNVAGVNAQGGSRWTEFMFNRNSHPYQQHTTGYNNTSLPGPITRQTEDAEYTRWHQKLAQYNITIGPLNTTN
jgi:hypothetical protein